MSRGKFELGAFRKGAAAVVLAVAMALGACAGAPEIEEDALISPQEEAKIGAAAHPEIVAQYGGAYDDHRLIGYLSEMVRTLSSNSGGEPSDHRLTVLDTPVVNAFASPGGYIYITRGLLALANDEAEVAAVLAHELGHLNARHSAKRQNAVERVTFLGGILGNLADSSYLADSLRRGAARSVAAYSREQELEADKLGMSIASKSQYDPTGAVTFLTSLERYFELEGLAQPGDDGSNNVSIYSTHPGTPERIRQARSYAYSFGDPTAGDLTGGYVRNRDAYLDMIDGLTYGDSVSRGMLRGRVFYHRALRFRFTVPEGFDIINHKDAVLGRGPDEAIFIFDGAEVAPSVSLKGHLLNNWGEGLDLRNVRSFTVNGLQAASAETLHKGVGHELVVIRHSATRVFRFLFITRPVVTAKFERAFRGTVSSFAKLTEAQVRQIKPLRIKLVTVRRGHTVNHVARLMAGDNKAARFRVLNGLGPEDKLEPGQRVKIVTR